MEVQYQIVQNLYQIRFFVRYQYGLILYNLEMRIKGNTTVDEF